MVTLEDKLMRYKSWPHIFPMPSNNSHVCHFLKSLISSSSASVSQHMGNPMVSEKPLKITQAHQTAAGRSKRWSGPVNMSTS